MQTIHWLHDLQGACVLAKAENKLILLDFYNPG